MRARTGRGGAAARRGGGAVRARSGLTVAHGPAEQLGSSASYLRWRPWVSRYLREGLSVYSRAPFEGATERHSLKILISNDDGYRAEGIRRLRDALATLAEVTVVAPDRNRSGASNSLTLDVPLRVFEAEPGVHFVVGGTPTDCVHMAVSGLFDFEHDMVVSGINDGANLGDDVLYSGTVAAAIEGRFLGLPAIAVSLCMQPDSGRHFAAGARSGAPARRAAPAQAAGAARSSST